MQNCWKLKWAKKLGGIIFALVILNNASAKDFALGLEVGEPSGLSARLTLDQEHSVDFGLGYALNEFGYVFSDYIWAFKGAFKDSEVESQLYPYVGVGAFLYFGSGRVVVVRKNGVFNSYDGGFGARFPLGILWNIPRAPVEIFLELVPGIGILPDTVGNIGLGLGARFQF